MNVQNEEVTRLRQDVRRLNDALYSEKLKARTRINDEQQRTQDAMMHVQRTQQRLEEQIPLYQQSLNAQKEELRNLEISEEDFMKLKTIPYEKKSLREFVLTQVHAYVKEHKREIERCHLEMEAMKSETERLQRTITKLEKNEEINQSMWRDTEAKLAKALD